MGFGSCNFEASHASCQDWDGGAGVKVEVARRFRPSSIETLHLQQHPACGAANRRIVALMPKWREEPTRRSIAGDSRPRNHQLIVHLELGFGNWTETDLNTLIPLDT